MYYQIDANKLLKVHYGVATKVVGGSSTFQFIDGEIVKVPRGTKEKPNITSVAVATDARQCADAPPTPLEKTYHLNKSRIRKKIAAFFETKKAEQFCAFYSITFPAGIADYIAYKLFNTWLTRCRKLQNMQSYIWVAERQKNETIHFHLLTSTRMNIRDVNGYMAKAIDTQRKRSNIQCQENIAEKYNGIDVDNLYYSKRHNRKGKKLSKIESKRKLGKYLTKYVSKNQTTMHRLPWHCSRDISALFDKQLFNKEEINEIIELSKTNPGAFVKYEKEHYTIYLPKFDYMLSQYTDIKTINDMLLDIYFQEAPPE